MSSTPFVRSEPPEPDRKLPGWFWHCLGADGRWPGTRPIGGKAFVIRGGISRGDGLMITDPQQTEEPSAFHWKKRDTSEFGLSVEREAVEEAGVAVIARKAAG